MSSRRLSLPFAPLLTGSNRIVRSGSWIRLQLRNNVTLAIDAVFFSSKCGVARGSEILSLGQGLPADEEESDSRCRSVDAAVQFAKSNNLLGVILNANLLVRCPLLSHFTM